MNRLFIVCLLLSGCVERVEPAPAECDPSASAGSSCSGEWACPATSIEGSTGTHYTELRCIDGVVHERTWTETPEPIPPAPIASCDPSAPAGASCEGGWECPVESMDGSTGIHHTQIRCEGDRVVRDFWIEPFETQEIACAVALDELVGGSTEGCGRPGLSVDGDRVRIAWSDVGPYAGVLAERTADGWTLDDTFGSNVRRIDLGGDVAMVERNGGTIELWELGDAPRLARTLEGVHVGAQARALGVGSVLHLLTTHTRTRPDNTYEWVIEHASGSIDALEVEELVVGTGRAYDVSLDEVGTASVLYQRGGIGDPVFLDGQQIPLPEGAEPHPYDDVAPVMLTRYDGSAYVLARRNVSAGPLGWRTEQLLMLREGGGWSAMTIATDGEDPCAAVAPTEGAYCSYDRTTYGPEASIVEGPNGPLVVLATHRTIGERTYTCEVDPMRCVPCRWEANDTTTHGLAVFDLSSGLVPVAVSFDAAPGFIATATGRDVHLAIADYDGDCTVRYVRLSCE